MGVWVTKDQFVLAYSLATGNWYEEESSENAVVGRVWSSRKLGELRGNTVRKGTKREKERKREQENFYN